MRRDPSLHVHKTVLAEALNELNYNARTTGAKLAEMIFEAVQGKQITDRYLKVLELKAPIKKKVAKSMEADGVPANLVAKFNMLLVKEREKLSSHARARGISKSNPQYTLLKEVAKMAHDFTVHFNITPKTDGYIEYIQLGLKFMRRYGLNRFKTYDQKIYEVFDCKVKVLTDPQKEYTQKFYAIWQDAMLKHTGMSEEINIDTDLVKYSHMVYGREAANECEAYYEDWIEAQFEGLQFLNAIPELSQYYGENAKLRYDRFMMKSSGNSKEEDILKIHKDG